MWLGSHGNDCGSSTILIYTFREREDLFDMYEAASGARMHAAYFRPVAWKDANIFCSVMVRPPLA